MSFLLLFSKSLQIMEFSSFANLLLFVKPYFEKIESFFEQKNYCNFTCNML